MPVTYFFVLSLPRGVPPAPFSAPAPRAALPLHTHSFWSLPHKPLTGSFDVLYVRIFSNVICFPLLLVISLILVKTFPSSLSHQNTPTPTHTHTPTYAYRPPHPYNPTSRPYTHAAIPALPPPPARPLIAIRSLPIEPQRRTLRGVKWIQRVKAACRIHPREYICEPARPLIKRRAEGRDKDTPVLNLVGPERVPCMRGPLLLADAHTHTNI